MYSSNDFPSEWKKTFIHFINKPNNKGMRPIALTSCLCKLFEIMLTSRLQWWAEYYKLIPNSQSGFRKGRSCTDNLVKLTLEIEEAFSKKQHVLAVFLDVEAAFPSVNNDILLNEFAEIDCSPKMLKFVKFLTYERFIFTDTLNNDYRKVHKGAIHILYNAFRSWEGS